MQQKSFFRYGIWKKRKQKHNLKKNIVNIFNFISISFFSILFIFFFTSSVLFPADKFGAQTNTYDDCIWQRNIYSICVFRWNLYVCGKQWVCCINSYINLNMYAKYWICMWVNLGIFFCWTIEKRTTYWFPLNAHKPREFVNKIYVSSSSSNNMVSRI